MKIQIPTKLRAWLFLLTLLPAVPSFGQYNQGATNNFALGANLIEKSATVLTATTFRTNVAIAWTNGTGGVLNLPTTVANPTTIYRGNYSNGKRFQITSSVNMQNITSGATSFTPISSPIGTTSSANQSDYTLTVGLFDTNSGLPLVGEVVKTVGFVMLSRGNTTPAYPLDIRATVTFNDGSTQAVSSAIGGGSGADDTFFGFSATGNLYIASIRLQSFATGTSTPVADRMAWDDFGFITGPSVIVPPPLVVGATPAAYAITNATNGIRFQALTYESVDPTNISLVVNASNVSSYLVFTGDPTNYSVAYNGLLPDQEYTMTIGVTNSQGAATLSRTFYTYASPVVWYDSESFTNDTLYPLGALTNVTHGRGTWTPDATEPAQIVDAGGVQGKVLERACTGASRVDRLSFPPVSSGTLIMEFDTFVSTTNGRTIDISLQPVSAGTTMASFLAWGEPIGKLAYFDNVTWQPLADLIPTWHHVKVVNYLSGSAAGRYDVLVDNNPIGVLIPWRNATVGSTFNQVRIQTANTAPLFEYGRIDNLVITAGPQTDAVLPPVIGNVSPSDRRIVAPAAGVQFNVTSALPMANSNIVLRLNDTPVAVNLSGLSTNLSGSYTQLIAGNYSLEIRATNSAGGSTFTSSFIAADEAWMIHPGDGWVVRWDWSTAAGMATMETNSPLDGAYLRLDFTNTTVRNFFRQYTSGTNLDLNLPHFIRWKFRMPENDFAANFVSFNDRAHFFGRSAARSNGGTDGATSWSISATGAEQTPGSGISAGQRFYIFDNLDNSGAYNLNNLVDSQIPLIPYHIYAFEVLVYPSSGTYTVAIDDLTTPASFRSAAPHKFRAAGVTPTSHTFLHFGVQVNTSTTPRPIDLDSVALSQAAYPVSLLAPVHTGTVFSFSFQSQPGVQHLAQYKSDVAAGGWTTLEAITGDGTMKTVTHTNPPAGPLFYRINSHLP